MTQVPAILLGIEIGLLIGMAVRVLEWYLTKRGILRADGQLEDQ